MRPLGGWVCGRYDDDTTCSWSDGIKETEATARRERRQRDRQSSERGFSGRGQRVPNERPALKRGQSAGRGLILLQKRNGA
jgi:hypothetical protein